MGYVNDSETKNQLRYSGFDQVKTSFQFNYNFEFEDCFVYLEEEKKKGKIYEFGKKPTKDAFFKSELNGNFKKLLIETKLCELKEIIFNHLYSTNDLLLQVTNKIPQKIIYL